MKISVISDTGFTVVYSPEDREPQIDIVFVHGLQGHPCGTWASINTVKFLKRESTYHVVKSNIRNLFHSWRTQSAIDGADGFSGLPSDPHKGEVTTPTDVYWPRDLLPTLCPEARISTWGYNTKVVERPGSSTNKNHLYSHGKDLVFALARHRVLDRPLILIGHSLGGILVKEALATAHTYHESKQDSDVANIVASTAAIVFMGTPHRGSPAMASAGEVGRKLASALLLDSNRSVLESLGLANSDLERCHDTFTSLWSSRAFRVKTFQEARPLSGINAGILNNLVVPHSSSSLGDPRERAETLDLNHMDMCRFTAADDSNYKQVGPAIESLYHHACTLNTSSTDPDKNVAFDLTLMRISKSLHFEHMTILHDQSADFSNIQSQWLTKSLPFQEWLSRRNIETHHGLLWIKGKPGAGKTSLMMEIRHLASQQVPSSTIQVASYFFDAGRSFLQKSPLGMFRALILQLLPKFDPVRAPMYNLYNTESTHSEGFTWTLEQLKTVMKQAVCEPSKSRTILIIDAIDECGLEEGRILARYFRNLTSLAYNYGNVFDVCISSRMSFSVSTRIPFWQIDVDEHNHVDIAEYVDATLPQDIGDWQFECIKKSICDRANGVFLWVRLVVDHLLQDWDTGRDFDEMKQRLDEVPNDLELLYAKILATLHTEERSIALRIFQWGFFASRPIRIAELHHIFAFIPDQTFDSLVEWRMSNLATNNDLQLIKKLRHCSRGLLEIRQRQVGLPSKIESMSMTSSAIDCSSMYPRAGSYELAETLQPIHHTVRQFFCQGRGFQCLYPSLELSAPGGHLHIIQLCIKYASLKEMLSRSRLRPTSSLVSLLSDDSCRPLLDQAVEPDQIEKDCADSLSIGSSASSTSSIDVAANSPGEPRSGHYRVTNVRGSHRRSDTSSQVPRVQQISRYHCSYQDCDYAIWGFHDESLLSTHLLQSHSVREELSLSSDLPRVWTRSWLESLDDNVSEDIGHVPFGSDDQSGAISTANSLKGGGEHLEVPDPSPKTYAAIEFPQLLNYVQENFAFHARQADQLQVNVDSFMKELASMANYRMGALCHDDPGATILYYAARENLPSWIGSPDSRIWLDPCMSGGKLTYPIVIAANKGNVEVCKALGRRTPSLLRYAKDTKGRSAFHHAAALGNTEMLSLLIYDCRFFGGINWTCEKVGDRTPLHYATLQSTLAIVELLLLSGADPRMKDKLGKTPRDLMEHRKYVDVKMHDMLVAAEAAFGKNDLSMSMAIASVGTGWQAQGKKKDEWQCQQVTSQACRELSSS